MAWRPTTARWEESVSEPKPKDKPFEISKWVVWEAHTAHVARQWLGSIGKVDNGIVAVSSLWADERV